MERKIKEAHYGCQMKDNFVTKVSIIRKNNNEIPYLFCSYAFPSIMVGESAGSEQSERNLCGLVSTEKEADALIMISDSEIDFEFGEHETCKWDVN